MRDALRPDLMDHGAACPFRASRHGTHEIAAAETFCNAWQTYDLHAAATNEDAKRDRWTADIMNHELRFAFRFERRTTGERAAWYAFGDGPEIGPLLVARRTHEKLSTLLSRAVAILTSVLTVEHSFRFRFARQGSGKVLVWVTIGDYEVGPIVPATADIDRVGFLLARVIASLLEAQNYPPRLQSVPRL